MFSALVKWPGAPLTDSLVRNALKQFQVEYIDDSKSEKPLLQWSSYDELDHELLMTRMSDVQASSYVFRKALIRKHYLSRIIHSYCTKNPDSLLKTSFPLTYEIDISFADELDELWADDLWEVGDRLDNEGSWWILKPGMADRGNGIRLFNSKDALQQIFEEFEEDSDDEEEDADEEGDNTGVMTSQLRHFVIQEYLSDPLLFDPRETEPDVAPSTLQGHKFHLRVYCVASGALKVFVYDRILALFAAVPYALPNFDLNEEDESPEVDLQPHLTNTCLQTYRGEEGVRLLDELVGCHILSGENKDAVLTADDVKGIVNKIGDVLGETFKAAIASGSHFQPLPNAFELYGIDFLVMHGSSGSAPQFDVKLLEINAEPAIEMTGPRLRWVLEDLFKTTADVCVKPFFTKDAQEEWPVGETRQHFLKCLDAPIRNWG